MGEKYRQQSLIEIMNEVLSDIRDYYDSDYAYYVEKGTDELNAIYEWCADGKPWLREQIRMLSMNDVPRWIKQEILDANDSDYSVFYDLGEGKTGILAAVGVRRGGCGLELLKTMAPYVGQILAFKKVEKKQEYLSYHDELTGLLNRNSYVEYLAETDTKSLKSLGAISVDINSLKKFNQEFGHDYGDLVVKRVGEVLEDYFKGERVFRLTGDEYLVLCENLSYDKFRKRTQEVYTKLNNISLDLVSLGYAWEKTDIELINLVSASEKMMRKEKQEYYNRDHKEHRPIIEQDLLDDIANGRYIVCLQPEFDIAVDALSGAEAMVRYHHKDMGIIDPKKNLDILDQTKLSYHLDIYVFEQVCKTIQNWVQRDIPLVAVMVHLSGMTLRREGIAEELMKYVQLYHVPTEYLVVKVDEGDSSMNQEMIVETSNKIRKNNIRVVLDNFGSKDSSMSILAMMDLDGMKLDHCIVEDIVRNHRCQIVARAVLNIATQLGIPVVASGVVTQDQLNMLREMGYEYAEGVLFNKPITIETFEKRYLGQ